MGKRNRDDDTIRYEMTIESWQLSYGFGEPMLRDSTTRHEETVTLHLRGKMVVPEQLAGITATARFHTFDFPIDQRKDDRPALAGEMSQDRETRELDMSLVMRLPALGAVCAALGSGAKGRMSCYGPKLRYRSARIARYWIEFGDAPDE